MGRAWRTETKLPDERGVRDNSSPGRAEAIQWFRRYAVRADRAASHALNDLPTGLPSPFARHCTRAIRAPEQCTGFGFDRENTLKHAEKAAAPLPDFNKVLPFQAIALSGMQRTLRNAPDL